ncbi:unnamed protein product [Adineta steineri]|uniref:Glycosyl transferase family 25 domain-containing protein n=1 Tax=Adineta steineri TaxID=433720 RepID=A0A814TN72_9BILA|nr:unnamed protein product [Adineta steineri]CAF1162449.1 unnamed protein product [Adineta steineri]
MDFIWNWKRSFSKPVNIICIILTVLGLMKIFNFHHFCNFNHWNQIGFKIDPPYHQDGIVYDYYSKNDLKQLKTSYQWKIWPLPQEVDPLANNSSIIKIETSPFAMSKLLFIDVIYIMTNSRLTERHDHLKKVFHRQGISMESVKWRMKWNQTTCNSNSTHSYVYKQLNLKDKPLDQEQQRRCAITIEHVDVWHEIIEQKLQLALILEDDVIFVPFFKEKLTRMIYTAIRSGALRMNGTCAKIKDKRMTDNEWINQNPMIVIGTCFNLHDQYFQKHLSDAPPLLSTHKREVSRCTHAYLLTLCSAQALINQIQEQKNDFLPSDHMQNYLIRLSPTLQSFWMDPPLAYQGNQINDTDKLETFKVQTYK